MPTVNALDTRSAHPNDFAIAPTASPFPFGVVRNAFNFNPSFLVGPQESSRIHGFRDFR
jgi:hypothetical protein